MAVVYAGTKNLLRNVPVDKVKEFEKDYLTYLNAKHRNEMDDLKAGKLTDEATQALEEAAKEVTSKYNAIIL